MKKLFVLALLWVASCTPQKSYVQADKAIYDVIAPAHEAYVEADATLSAEQKARRLRTLAAWKVLIEKAGQ